MAAQWMYSNREYIRLHHKRESQFKRELRLLPGELLHYLGVTHRAHESLYMKQNVWKFRFREEPVTADFEELRQPQALVANKKIFSLLPKKNPLANTLTLMPRPASDYWPPRRWDEKHASLKPPKIWKTVISVIGNQILITMKKV